MIYISICLCPQHNIFKLGIRKGYNSYFDKKCFILISNKNFMIHLYIKKYEEKSSIPNKTSLTKRLKRRKVKKKKRKMMQIK